MPSATHYSFFTQGEVLIIPYCYLQRALPCGSALPNTTSQTSVLERPKRSPKIKVLTRELQKYITDCISRGGLVQIG